MHVTIMKYQNGHTHTHYLSWFQCTLHQGTLPFGKVWVGVGDPVQCGGIGVELGLVVRVVEEPPLQ